MSRECDYCGKPQIRWTCRLCDRTQTIHASVFPSAITGHLEMWHERVLYK